MSVYSTIESNQDGIELLKLIQIMCHQHDESKHGNTVIVNLDKRAFLYYQHPNQTNTDYLAKFKAIIKGNETYNGGEHPGLWDIILNEERVDLKSSNQTQCKEATKKPKEQYLVCLFISVADNTRYKQLKNNFWKMRILKGNMHTPSIMKWH